MRLLKAKSKPLSSHSYVPALSLSELKKKWKLKKKKRKNVVSKFWSDEMRNGLYYVKRAITILSLHRSSALKRLKEVYWYWQWRHPKSLRYLEKILNTGYSYDACLHGEYLPRAIPCLFDQIFTLASSFTCVSSLMCDFSRAIDMLAKLEQVF